MMMILKDARCAEIKIYMILFDFYEEMRWDDLGDAGDFLQENFGKGATVCKTFYFYRLSGESRFWSKN
jgi:hypothetical protein